MCNVQPDLQNFITEKLMNIWIWDVWLLWPPPPEVTEHEPETLNHQP